MAGCTNQVSYEVVYTSIYACAHMMHALIGSYIACIILYVGMNSEENNVADDEGI